jgi:hypothetical protein
MQTPNFVRWSRGMKEIYFKDKVKFKNTDRDQGRGRAEGRNNISINYFLNLRKFSLTPSRYLPSPLSHLAICYSCSHPCLEASNEEVLGRETRRMREQTLIVPG